MFCETSPDFPPSRGWADTGSKLFLCSFNQKHDLSITSDEAAAPQPNLHVLKKTFILSFNWRNCWATTWRQPVTLTLLPVGTRSRIVFYSVYKSTSDKNVEPDNKSWCYSFLQDLQGTWIGKRMCGKYITVCKLSAQCRGVILRIGRESICVSRGKAQLHPHLHLWSLKHRLVALKGFFKVFWCGVVWGTYT